jgi:hypothetical protein
MSQTKPPFFEALSQHPSRLKSAVDDLNFVASAPELGASFDQIKQVHHVLQTNAGQTGKEYVLLLLRRGCTSSLTQYFVLSMH